MESRWRKAIPIGALSAVVGFGAGLMIAGFVGALGGVRVTWVITFFPLVTGISGYLVGALVIESAGDGARRLFMGSPVGTRAQYSVAEGLAARGQYDAALEAYTRGAEEEPADPTPLIRGARLLRDELGRPREAIDWLKRARAVGRLGESEEITITLELADLYEEALDDPAQAMPELAMLAERFSGTRPGEMAARRLRELRRVVHSDE